MRDINWDEPLSEEDKAWARQASLPMVEERIAANERQFDQESSAATEVPPDHSTRSALDPTATANQGAQPTASTQTTVNTGQVEDDYEQWKVNELKAEADSREPKVEYASDARKPDLIAALRQWDQDNPEA